MTRKDFFEGLTKAEIRRKNYIETNSLTDILGLNNGEYTLIQNIIPKGYADSRKFMKHGPEVKLKRFYTLEQAVKSGKTPIQLREEAFNSLAKYDYCGYSFLPVGKDRRKRKISLVECLEGARIFAYAHQIAGTKVGIKEYADAKKVRREGAEVIADVPSRQRKVSRVNFKFTSIPIIDSPEKYSISLNIGSDHSCPVKRFNIRYKYIDDKESSGVFNFCAHEIAAYLELVQKEWSGKKNIIPLQMCQFAIPTQETVNYYLKLENNVLVQDNYLKSKDKIRKLNKAEKEIGLWMLVRKLGHDKTFYSVQSRDGNVRDYNWKIS